MNITSDKTSPQTDKNSATTLTIQTEPSILPRLAQHYDIFHYLLDIMSLNTILTTRVLSTTFNNSIKDLCFYYTNKPNPLFLKTFVSFNLAELFTSNQKFDSDISKKLDFVKQNNIRINLNFIRINDLKSPSALLNKLKPLNFPLTTLKLDNLTDLNILKNSIKQSELSDDQKSILKTIKGIDLSNLNITQDNAQTIQDFLKLLQDDTLLPDLTSLSFGDIDADLTIPTFHNLTALSFGNILADLTIPTLHNLASLSFANILADLTIPTLPNLTALSFANILVDLTIPTLNSLTSLYFGFINARANLTIPESLIKQLTTFWYENHISNKQLPAPFKNRSL